MNECGFSHKIRTFLQDRSKVAIAGTLLAILALGAFLRFYQLGQAGVNEYYAAAVKSMLLSWKNFFYVAFEPGGSVSLDKPPLGFWIEAVSAYFLGVNGFALALPNAIAGVLSIFLVYKLLRRPFGAWAGLVAALALAVTPVVIATERNNTIDGMLVFVLLLAAWAFLQSVYTGKVRWLFLGAFIVGLAFNIKMLQAFMPLPAFYAVYFFGTKQNWLKKSLYLGAATVLLLVVSFSWAIAVDLTSAADRPYVDSTSGNSVMELIFGHNGIERLANSGGSGSAPSRADLPQGALLQPPDGQAFTPPAAGSDGQFGPAEDGGQPGGGPGGILPGDSMDFGTAGTLRLFTQPLLSEASWLLPFVLGGLIVLVIALWRQPFGQQQGSLILWAGWLLPEILYFTYSRGLMHAYYLIMLGAPIAALAAMTVWALWQIIRRRWLLGWTLATLLVGGTLTFETYALLGNTSLDVLAVEIAGILFSLGFLMALAGRRSFRLAEGAGLSLLLAAMLVAPTVWSGLTTFNSTPSGLPSAGPAGQQRTSDNVLRARNGDDDQTMLRTNVAYANAMPGISAPGSANGVNQNLLNYLLANTQPGTYLVAAGRANSAAPYILATGRPVLALGGFLDQYEEVSVDQIASLVKSGQLRFILGDALDRHQTIAEWVKQNCTLVDSPAYSSPSGSNAGNSSGPSSNTSLYQCGA